MARRMIFKSFVFPILILCCHRMNDKEWFSSWLLFTDCRFGNTHRSLPSLFTSLHDQVGLETKSSIKNIPIGHFIKTFSIAKRPWMNRSTSLEMSRVSQKLYNLHHGHHLFSIDLWSTLSLDSLCTFQERKATMLSHVHPFLCTSWSVEEELDGSYGFPFWCLQSSPVVSLDRRSSGSDSSPVHQSAFLVKKRVIKTMAQQMFVCWTERVFSPFLHKSAYLVSMKDACSSWKKKYYVTQAWTKQWGALLCLCNRQKVQKKKQRSNKLFYKTFSYYFLLIWMTLMMKVTIEMNFTIMLCLLWI